jgi:hypothetical protein
LICFGTGIEFTVESATEDAGATGDVGSTAGATDDAADNAARAGSGAGKSLVVNGAVVVWIDDPDAGADAEVVDAGAGMEEDDDDGIEVPQI